MNDAFLMHPHGIGTMHQVIRSCQTADLSIKRISAVNKYPAVQNQSSTTEQLMEIMYLETTKTAMEY